MYLFSHRVMTSRNTDLGEFEQLVLLATLRLGDDAYAPGIARVLEERAAREMSRGTLYGALERLERKGFVAWRVEPATQRRGGRRRRCFRVTADGIEALAELRSVMARMWEGMNAHLTGGGA